MDWRLRGTAGADGVANAYATSGVSSQYADSNNLPFIPRSGNTTVAELTVPAGNYLVFGKVQAMNNVTSVVVASRTLSTGDTLFVRLNGSSREWPGNGDVQTLTVQDVAQNVPAGTVITMNCQTGQGGAYYPRLTAIPLAAINGGTQETLALAAHSRSQGN